MERQIKNVNSELELKASQQNLHQVEQTLIGRINELMSNFGQMFADRDGTYKKLA
jgi:hypothetical protein